MDERHKVYWHDLGKYKQVRHGAEVTFTPDELTRFQRFVGFWNADLKHLGVDSWAARMSRSPMPNDSSRLAVGDETFYRISLLTSLCCYDPEEFMWAAVKEHIFELHSIEDPEKLHRIWLKDCVVSGYNESPYHPYTSLKYHTVLAASLYDNLVRSGKGRMEYTDGGEGICMVLRGPTDLQATCIFAGPEFSLHLDREARPSEPAAPIGGAPARNFGDVWSNMPRLPRLPRRVDAMLRRIASWTVALQYLEEVLERESECSS